MHISTVNRHNRVNLVKIYNKLLRLPECLGVTFCLLGNLLWILVVHIPCSDKAVHILLQFAYPSCTSTLFIKTQSELFFFKSVISFIVALK